MSPPSTNSSAITDALKAKITSLVKEQLKPIVTELAAQQRTLHNNLALLRHNHNVNDYQMTRLESIRDLEQSVNFKVSGVLGFDPWQHPTMGTNLREPVPADPELIPKFAPVNKATPAERAAQSTALIKEAGMSARRIGVPLTFQDFPDHPSMNSAGKKKEDPMHASIPLFGLRNPRWRAKLGLDAPEVPGTAAYNGVVAPPVGKTGLKLYSSHAKELKVPMWKLVEQGVDGLGIGATSSSSSPGAGTSSSSNVQGGRSAGTSTSALSKAGASFTQIRDTLPSEAQRADPSDARTAAARRPSPPSSSSTTPAARPKPLYRTYAIADMEDSIMASTSAHNKVPKPTGLHRTSTMNSIGSTTSITSETSTHSSFSRVSTTATIGSERGPSSTAKARTTKTKTKTKAKQSQRSNTRTKTSTTAPTSTSSSTTSSTIAEQPKQQHTSISKRRRRTAELEDTADDMITDNFQDREEVEPARKRRKPSVAAVSDTSSESTARRSTRVTRASAAAATNAQPRPAPRGRGKKGKKV